MAKSNKARLVILRREIHSILKIELIPISKEEAMKFFKKNNMPVRAKLGI